MFGFKQRDQDYMTGSFHQLKLLSGKEALTPVQCLDSRRKNSGALSAMQFAEKLAKSPTCVMCVVLVKLGRTPQEAVDEVHDKISEKYKEWEKVLRELPKWGGETDSEVFKLVVAIANVVWGNVAWW
ncbi:hypothetical protein TWF694_008809 [Orbilia ellipsospora]|uniref:Uncharacterized protein n=1 Tax=Orbilia ellipsospora TaxID=2528407 RepID=A0AAV9XD06_9PEZI